MLRDDKNKKSLGRIR